MPPVNKHMNIGHFFLWAGIISSSRKRGNSKKRSRTYLVTFWDSKGHSLPLSCVTEHPQLSNYLTMLFRAYRLGRGEQRLYVVSSVPPVNPQTQNPLRQST